MIKLITFNADNENGVNLVVIGYNDSDVRSYLLTKENFATLEKAVKDDGFALIERDSTVKKHPSQETNIVSYTHTYQRSKRRGKANQ